MKGKKLEIFKAIKERRTIRQFNTRHVPISVLRKIIEAARWAPCPNNIEPWRFVIARKGNPTTGKIIRLLQSESQKRNISVSIFLKDAFKILKAANIAIYVFNTKVISAKYKKLGMNRDIQKKASLFEHQAISAAIENLTLCAEKFRLGTVWLGSPVFLSKDIERIFNTDFELNAIISMGYFGKKPKRTKRLPISKIAKYI